MYVPRVPFNKLVSTYFLNGCLCKTVPVLMLPHDWFLLVCVCVSTRVPK